MRTRSRLVNCCISLVMASSCTRDASGPLRPDTTPAAPALVIEVTTTPGLDLECDRVEFSELPAIQPDGVPAIRQVRRLSWASCVLSGHGLAALYLDEVVTVLADGSEAGTAVGSFTLTDGSILRFHSSSRAPDRDDSPSATYRFDMSFTGGTGRMTGATGRARGILFVDFFARFGVLQGDGVLRAD